MGKHITAQRSKRNELCSIVADLFIMMPTVLHYHHPDFAVFEHRPLLSFANPHDPYRYQILELGMSPGNKLLQIARVSTFMPSLRLRAIKH